MVNDARRTGPRKFPNEKRKKDTGKKEGKRKWSRKKIEMKNKKEGQIIETATRNPFLRSLKEKFDSGGP